MKGPRPMHANRVGFALVAALAVLAVGVTLCGLWTRRILDQRRLTERWRQRVQVELLAEAGLQRARALRAADPNYQGETWVVAAEEWGWPRDAEVALRVEDAGEAQDSKSSMRVTATARYPREGPLRVQMTKTFTPPLPSGS